MTQTKTFSLRTLSKAVLLVSLALGFGMHSSFALEALNTDELANVNGQDGITIGLQFEEDSAANNEVSALTADHIVYTADNQSIYLSNVKLGAADSWGVANSNQTVTLQADIDIGAGVHNGVSQPVISLKGSWGDLANLDNRMRIVSNLQIGEQTSNNTIAKVIYEGAGEVLLETSGLTSDYATEYTNGYITLKNNNIFLLNPKPLNNIYSGFGLRDIDANLIFKTGTFDTLAKDGSTSSFDYQSHFGIGQGIGADGLPGLFLESNRMQFDVDLVLTHISDLTSDQFNLYNGQSLRTSQTDFFGVKFTGEIPNTVIKLGSNSTSGTEGVFALFQATFDDTQYDLQLPSLAIYQPQNILSDGSNYFTTGENNEGALRLDNFRQFHTLDQYIDLNGVTHTKPAIYLPITLDTIETNVAGGLRDSLRLTINDPGSNGILDDNIGLEGGIVDLYIEDLNVGTLDSPGNPLGGLVASLNKINGTIDLTPAQTIAGFEQEGAMLVLAANLDLADSGLGIIQQSTGGNQSRIFAGIRDLDLDIVANSWIGTNNEGLRVYAELEALSNDFQIGIATAYDAPEQIHLNGSFGNIGDPFADEDVLLTNRLYLNTVLDGTVKPSDEGLASIDATLSFIGSSEKFDKDANEFTAHNLFYVVDKGDPNAADPTQEGFAWGVSNVQGGFRSAHTNGLSGASEVVNENALISIKNDSTNHKADGTTENVDSLNVNVPFEIVKSAENVNNFQGDFDVQFYGASDKTTLFNYYVPQGFQGRVNVEVWGQNN